MNDTDAETVPVRPDPIDRPGKSLQSNADEGASGDVSLNDTLTYEFVATNDGTVTLDNVTISDPLPSLSALSCVPVAGSSLAPTESMTCTATYTVVQGDVDAGQIDNIATVNATDPGGNPVDDADAETVIVGANPSIDLVKILFSHADEDASGDVTLNDTLTYQFVATNDGTVTLDNVTIADPLAGCGNPLDATDAATVPVEQNPVIGLAKDVSSVFPILGGGCRQARHASRAARHERGSSPAEALVVDRHLAGTAQLEERRERLRATTDDD